MPVKPGRPSAEKAAEQPYSTRLESDEEIQQVIQARRDRLAAQARQAAQKDAGAVPLAEPVEPEAQAERPILRPPQALLCILDDGKGDGEWVRLRADVTAIGRVRGDVLIPHDGFLSEEHAKIIRQRIKDKGTFRWLLVDMQSSNGTFARISNSILHHEHEFLVGSGRYRFESGSSPGPGSEPKAGVQGTTQAWNDGSIRSLVPSLVELTPAGPVNRFPLTLPEYWIGRNARTCTIARPDDLLASSRHARLYRDPQGGWHVENNKSVNGLWLRIKEPMVLSGPCHLRMGEQKFLFRLK